MLTISKSFFEYLNNQGVRYCHWKSNEHLEQALSGKTDLDILVHIDDKLDFENALKIFSFKKIISPPEKQFPGMSDYLGFDSDTGNFIHLHVHYQLILGQRFIKNHHLPIEDLIFKNLILKDDVKIPCPELELILLIIRANMKVDVLSLLKHAIKDVTSNNGYTAYPAAIGGEIRSLIQRSNIEKLKNLLYESKLPIRENLFLQFIQTYSDKNMNFYHIVAVQNEVLKSLKEYRRNTGLRVLISYASFYIKEIPYLRKLFRHTKKTLNGEGKIISIVGADGSGKSSLICDLDKWLSWKLCVNRYYYGIPKNLIGKSVSFFTRGFNKVKLTSLEKLINYFFWIYVARTRYLISLSSKRAIKEGKIVITDRYPMREFYKMPEPMDGPRLQNEVSFTGRYFSKIESGYYEKILDSNYLIVLQVNLEDLRKRKSDLSYSNHEIKAQAVNSIKERGNVKIIDANKPYSEVLLNIKKIIWNQII